MWKILALILILSLAVGSNFAQVSQPADQQPQNQQPANQPPQNRQLQNQRSSDEMIRRGEYLVHHVAKCIECHTPRDSRGRLIHQRLLQGAPIPVESPYPEMEWAFESPQIAGLPGWEPHTVETLLQTGRRPNGRAPRAPMPTFHMHAEDARAVVAYLKSL